MGSWGDKRCWRWVATATAAAALLCALCALTLAAVPAAQAEPGQEIEFGKTDLSGLRAQARDIRTQVERLDRKAGIAIEKYDKARADLDATSARLLEMRRRLAATQHQLDVARLALSQRLVTMYKSDDLTLLDVMLNAHDFSDIGTQLDYMRLMSRADQGHVRQVADLTRQVTQLTAQLERDRDAALEKETALRELRADVEDQLAQRQALLDGVNGRIKDILARQRKAAAAAAGRLAGTVDLDSIVATDVQRAVVRETMRYLGVPYVWAGASPGGGFDCSGLVMYVFAKFGVRLPHAATYQARMGTPVPLDQLQPADLVFFGTPSFYHHVGIYAGNGYFIEAPHTGDVVKVSVLAGRGATLACRYPLRLQ